MRPAEIGGFSKWEDRMGWTLFLTLGWGSQRQSPKDSASPLGAQVLRGREISACRDPDRPRGLDRPREAERQHIKGRERDNGKKQRL